MYRVVNPIIMAILFFGAILPIGLAMRWFGKDFLRLVRIVRRRPIGCDAPIRGRHPNPCGSNSRASQMSFLLELFAFIRARRKFWLIPIFAVMLVLGGLLVLTKGSALAPFVYTLF